LLWLLCLPFKGETYCFCQFSSYYYYVALTEGRATYCFWSCFFVIMSPRLKVERYFAFGLFLCYYYVALTEGRATYCFWSVSLLLCRPDWRSSDILLWVCFLVIISSPELKAQVSYSDRPLSVVRLSVNFYIFDFFSRTTGPILTRLGTNHPWGEGILNCTNEGDCLSPRGDHSERVKIH
jgi:hypothetical protein